MGVCDDLISRQSAIDAIVTWTVEDRPDIEMPTNLVDRLLGLPSVQQWIPCSERLPKNDDWVIVTILDESGDTPWRYTDFGWYLEEANCWIVDAEQRKDIVAWMPLPEPYKEKKNDAKIH